MRPDLVYTNGSVPRVDVLHLHHGVWLNLSDQDATSPGLPERFFAAGEEKTISTMPKGYGYEYEASDNWLLNHDPQPDAGAGAGLHDPGDRLHPEEPHRRPGGIKPVRPIWMDVRNGQIYPVFNVEKGSGEKGEYTYPNDEPAAYRGESKRNEWVADRDGVLVATAGHLHPGGYHTDLWVRRQGAKVAKPACASKSSSSARKACKARAPRGYGSNAHLFRSVAKY